MLPLFNNAIYASAAINNYNNVADAAPPHRCYMTIVREPPRRRAAAASQKSVAAALGSLARVPLDIPVNLCQGET